MFCLKRAAVSFVILTASVLVLIAPNRAIAQRANKAALRNTNRSRAVNVAGTLQSPVQMTHQTLKSAAHMMESALPIYDGHRHRAIELTRLAEQELREAAATASGRTVNGIGTQRLRPAQRATMISKHHEGSHSRYSQQQIAASNAQMQQGLQMLSRGLQQLQSLGRDSGGHMADAVELVNMAGQEGNMALQWMATRR